MYIFIITYSLKGQFIKIWMNILLCEYRSCTTTGCLRPCQRDQHLLKQIAVEHTPESITCVFVCIIVCVRVCLANTHTARCVLPFGNVSNSRAQT